MSRAPMLIVALLGFAGIVQAAPLTLRVLGQPTGSGLIQQKMEQPFFEHFAQHSTMDVRVGYVPLDVSGIPATNELRVLKNGLFNIVSIRGSQVSGDAPTVLGFDLVGLNTDYASGKVHVKAFMPIVDADLQKRFGVKLLGMWPAGPQVIFCKPRIRSLADLKNLKVRVGDQSAAAFVAKFGAVGVPLSFGEVQQALARGVVDCAITGPASANSAGWPEVTTTVLPVPLQLAMNGYAINLQTWNKLSPADQKKLQRAIDTLDAKIWAYSEELYKDSMRCNTGQQPCEHGSLYHLTAAPVTKSDMASVKQALFKTSLPLWTKECDAVNPSCEKDWLATVGATLKH